MYSFAFNGMETSVLANFSFLGEFDPGISVVETRSLSSYLYNNLIGEAEKLKKDTGKLTNLFKKQRDFTIRSMEERLNMLRKLEQAPEPKEKTKLKQQISEYEIKLNSYKETTTEEIINSNRLELFKDSISKLLKPEVLEINENNQDALVMLFFKNLIDQSSVHTYIAHGSIGSTSHYFYVNQINGSQIIHKDSVGYQEREDFFDIFVSFPSQFKFNRSTDRLQYHTGVCETYSILCSIYDMRLRLYNSNLFNLHDTLLTGKGVLDEQQVSTILPNLTAKNDKTAFFSENNNLVQVFTDGMKEIALSNNLDLERSSLTKRRKDILQQQIVALETHEIAYSVDENFESMFKNDLQKALELFNFLSNSPKADIFIMDKVRDTRSAIINILKSENKKYGIGENGFNGLKIIISPIITAISRDENFRQDLGQSIREFYTIKKGIDSIKSQSGNATKEENNFELAKKRIIDLISIASSDEDVLDSFLNEFNDKNELHKNLSKFFNFIGNGIDFNALITKEFVKMNKIDLNSKTSFIKAGHIYWKTLEYVEMFDRRVTKYILSKTDQELSKERKKAMLSAIYPNNDSFYIVNRGQNDIYLKIDDHYNGDNYAKVVNLLNGNYTYTKPLNMDVSEIFTDIIQSQDPLDNLSHFIAWNRAFREDIFKYVATASDDNFNQKIVQFFFETEQINKDYVNIVARKYTLKGLTKEQLTDENLDQFVNLVLVTEGNDREDNTFKETLNNGMTLFKNDYSFRQSISSYIVSKPEIENIYYKINTLPIYKYLTENEKICDAFTIKFNLTKNSTENINIAKDYAKDFISRVTKAISGLNESDISEKEKDIDEFAGVIKDKVVHLKNVLLQPSPQAVAKTQSDNKSQGNKNKKGENKQQKEEKSEEEQVWIDFQNKLEELEQKFNPNQNVNLQNLHNLFNNI